MCCFMTRFRQVFTAMLALLLLGGVKVLPVQAQPLADAYPPVVGTSVNPPTQSWTNSTVFFTASATDPDGVKATYCKREGDANWTVGGSTCQLQLTYNSRVFYYATDNANNSSNQGSLSVCNIDTVSPWNMVGMVNATEANGAANGAYVPGGYDPAFTWPVAVDPQLACNSVDINGSGTRGYYVYWGTNAAGTSSTLITAASYNPPAITANGTYYLRASAIDNAGNSSAWITLFRLTIDNDRPTVTASPSRPGSLWGNTPVTVTITASDASSGINQTFCRKDTDAVSSAFTGSTCTLTFSANGQATYSAVDNAGYFSADGALNVCNIDTDPPIILDMAAELGGAVDKGAVKAGYDPHFTLPTASEPANTCIGITGTGSGVTGYYVYWGTDASGTSTAFQTGTGYDPAAVTTNGAYYLRQAAKDLAGNISAWKTVFTMVVSQDTDLPVASYMISPTGWTNGNVLVTVTATDATSGVAMVYCSSDGMIWGMDPSSCTLTITGNQWFSYYAQDKAGNKSATVMSAVCNIDKSSPLFPGSSVATESGGLASGGTLTTSRALTFTLPTAVDPYSSCRNILEKPGSGVDGYYVYFGQSATGTSTTLQTDTGFTTPVIAQSGTYYLRSSVHDLAGNKGAWTTLFTFTANITDTTPPNVTYIYSPIGWTNRDVLVTITASDSGSGVKMVTCSSDGQNWLLGSTSCQLTLTQNQWFSYYATDNAGNKSMQAMSAICNIDKAPPLFNSGKAVESGGLVDGGTLTASRTLSFTLPPAVDPYGSCRNILEKPGSGVDGYYVYFGQDAAGTSSSLQADAEFITPMVTGKGIYYLRGAAQDAAGNSGVWITLFTFTADITGPSLNVTLKGDPKQPQKGIIQFDGIASDNGVGGLKVEYSVDGGKSWMAVTVAQDGAFSFQWDTTKVKDGAAEVKVRATDSNNQAILTSIGFTVDNLLEIYMPVVVR